METMNCTIEKTKNSEWVKRAEIVSLDNVKQEEIDWLWPNHIPLGMLTLIAGDPGVGKSFLTLYMAAVVSRGQNWPNETSDSCLVARDSEQLGSRSESGVCPARISQRKIQTTAGSSLRYDAALRGSVIILNNEDSAEKVICPRLAALNADLSKIKTIPFVWHRDKNGNEFTNYFNIITDLFELETTISENPDTKLIIIDPLSAFFGCLDTHNDSYVRAILTPIVALAGKYNVAIVGVMHLNKGSSTKALYRTMGSLAFPAAARTVWLVSKIPNSPDDPRRLFIPAKHNILEKPATLAFEIKDNRVVFEKEPVDIPAEVVLSSKSNIEAPERDRAIEWLKKLLADGKEMPAKEITKMAAAEGFREHTLRKAREETGIKCFPEYDEQGNKYWCWKLSEPMKIPGMAEMLRNARKQVENMQKSRNAYGA
jgi:putative DNA primase/helicase